jgi:hypothetical protein
MLSSTPASDKYFKGMQSVFSLREINDLPQNTDFYSLMVLF